MAHRPLIEVLSEVPDRRHAQGKRYPLSAILGLCVAATLCGYRSYGAMAKWGQHYGGALAQALGFENGQTPCAATLYLAFRSLDVQSYDDAIAGWAEEVLMDKGDNRRAIDGKTLRGSKKRGAHGAHLLSVVSHTLGLTVRHEAVEEKTNEIGASLALLEKLVIEGRVFTMDALLTQREIAAHIVQEGGDYVQVAKDNQRGLKDDIHAILATPSTLAAPLRTAHTCDHAHGRREERRLSVREVLPGDCDWPGVAQVFRIERMIVTVKTGEVQREEICGVTSRARHAHATARWLLQTTRDHWVIENRSHYVRDVTFDEDRSAVRTGVIHQALATMRTTAISLMRLAGHDNIADACRYHAAQPTVALTLLGICP